MNDRPKTRVSLILRLGQPADAEAWEEFCDIYLPVIFRIAKARGLQDADAHDVSQNVLVRVARSVKDWSPDAERGSFGAWLGTITRNLLIDFLRNRQNHHQTSSTDNAVTERASMPDENAAKKPVNSQPNNPLHGVKLADILEHLVEQYGWEELGRRIRINCFNSDPSIKSSLKFLRRTEWAREKVERLYLRSIGKRTR